MEMKPIDLRHVVFETKEEGRIDAMWSDVQLYAHDIPDGWHCYAVRGGEPHRRHHHTTRPRAAVRQAQRHAHHHGLVV